MSMRRCRVGEIITGAAALTFLLGAASGPRLRAEQNPAQVPSRIDPKAQQVIDRVIRALGGPAFLKMKRLTTRGRIFSITDESTSGFAPFESAVEYPDKRRFSYGKRPPVILINNGDQAWELDRYGQTAQTAEQARRWRISNRYSLENLLRLRIHESGILIQPGGVDFVDNVATQALEMVDAQETQLKLDLNRQTILPVSITYRVRDPKTGEWDEFADVYSDYKNIEGVMTPMHIARFFNEERVSEIFRSSAHYDDEYPSTYFQPVQ
jgi:hypothetical protein